MSVPAPDGWRPLPGRLTVKLVGCSFIPEYPRNLQRLRLLVEGGETGQAAPLPATLVREPDNPYDQWAVAVHTSGGMVGHLPRWMAERLAPELDAGWPWRVWIVEIPVMPGREEQPGCKVECVRPARRSA